jgi:hypothetical protein
MSVTAMLAEGPFRSLLAPSDFAGFISPVSLTYSFWPRKIFSQERLQSSQRVRSKGQGNDESPREKTARAEFEPCAAERLYREAAVLGTSAGLETMAIERGTGPDAYRVSGSRRLRSVVGVQKLRDGAGFLGLTEMPIFSRFPFPGFLPKLCV